MLHDIVMCSAQRKANVHQECITGSPISSITYHSGLSSDEDELFQKDHNIYHPGIAD